MLKRFIFNWVTAKLVFFFLLVVFLCISTYIGQLLLRKENQVQNHKLSTELLSEKVQVAINQRVKVINNLARNSHVIDVINGKNIADNPQVNLALNTSNEVTNSELILILNDQGTVISSTDNYSESLTGENYSFRPYFQKSIAGNPDVFPAVGAVTLTRGIYLSAPIFKPGLSSPSAVIALKIGIEEIESILHDNTEINALVSPEGVIFSSNRPEWLFHSVYELDPRKLSLLEKTRQFGTRAIKKLAVSLDKTIAEIDGKKYRVLKTALPFSGWNIYSCRKASALPPLPALHRVVLAASVVIVAGMGTLVFLLTTNIFYRHKTELMLAKVEEKYFRIFKNATMGIFQSSLAGKYLEASPSMAAILGYKTPEQLCSTIINSARQVYVIPEDREAFIRKLQKDKTVKGFETRFYKANGEIIWVSISGRIVHDDPRLGTYLEGFCLDISENKKAQEALKRERNIFSRVMETVPVGIVMMDRNEKVSYANPKAREIFRLIKDQETGKYLLPPWQMMDPDGHELPAAQQLMSKALNSRIVLQDERVRIRRQGEPDDMIVSFNIAPLFDQQNEVQELVVAFTDISAKVEAEKKASLQQEQLIRADRMISLGILTSGIAHEINNPNTFILSNAELLAEAWQVAGKILDHYYQENGEFYLGGLPYSVFRNKAEPLCSRIVEGASRIKYIVQELREYSAQEAADLTTGINLNSVIQSAQILLGNMIKKSTYHFTMDLAENLPLITGNFHRLEQVIINIIQNACQALPDPSRKLTIQTRYELETGCVVFNCLDEGTGIPEHELGHVMDPFFTTKREIGGIGLGLSISSNIVRVHGGEIFISSSCQTGTNVRIELPVLTSDG